MAARDSGPAYRFVVAIDFRTSFSGYAYSYTNAPTNIMINNAWGNELGTSCYKTPTCLLTTKGKTKEFVAFGYEAISLFRDDPDASSKYCIFENFKMTLYNTKAVTKKTEIKSVCGQTMAAVEAISMSLKFFAGHVLKALQDSQESPLDKSLIRWVITVPAIWTDGAKLLMRRAAVMAEIIPKMNSQRLVLALEPEAASFWCRNLSKHQLCGKNSDNHLRPGQTYIVVDCGGGTTDITVHKFVASNEIKEICRPVGGDGGGARVNDNYVAILGDLMAPGFIEKWQKLHPSDWAEMMLEFENKKRSYKKDKNLPITISLPACLAESFQKYFGKPLTKYDPLQEITGASLVKGKIILQPDRVELLFAPVILKISEFVQEVIRSSDLKKPPKIFLVGGLSDCELLQTKIREISKHVIIPLEAGISVMKGAVLFGHNPHIIVSRVMQMTYGQSVHKRFNEDEHNEAYKTIIDNEERCDGLFKIWVSKNESVKVGESRSFTTYPYDEKSKFAYTEVYTVDREEVKYVDEPGVIKIGKLKIPVPDRHLPIKERPVETSVIFGETELRVRIEDKARDSGYSMEKTFYIDDEMI